MDAEIAPRLARNSLYYAAKSIVALVSMLLVTPFVLRVLGTELFGVWALAAVVISYAQLSEFGIGESVVKYAAEFYARGDTVALNRLVNTVLLAYLVLAALLGSLLLLALPFIARDILLIPAVRLEEAVLVFRLSVGIFFVNMVMGIFASLVVATQQIGYATFVHISSTCLGAAGTFYFLGQGFGLMGLIATNALVALLVALLNLIVAYRLVPGLHLGLGRWADRGMLRQVFGYSWKVQMSNLAQLLVFQLDRVLISRYLGLETVAFYEIGSNIALYARTFILTLFSPLIPAASALHALGEEDLLAGLYKRSFKFAVMIALPGALLVIGLAHPFIRVWMGEGFTLSALTLQLLMPVYLLNVLTSPGVFLLNGMNRPEIGMKAAVFAGLSNLLLCFLLIRSAGYYGLIGGIALSLGGATIYFTAMLHQALPSLGRKIYRPILLRPLLVCVPAALALFAIGRIMDLATLPRLGLAALLYLGVAGIFLLKSGYLDAFERQILLGTFFRPRRA